MNLFKGDWLKVSCDPSFEKKNNEVKGSEGGRASPRGGTV